MQTTGHQNGTGHMASAIMDEWGEEYADFNKMPPDNQAIYEMVKATVEWFGEMWIITGYSTKPTIPNTEETGMN